MKKALAADTEQVKSFRYLDHQAAYNEFKEDFKDQPALVESASPEVLPESFRVVPRSGGRLHPLCAAYNRRVREAVDRRVASGALAVQALFDEVRVDVVEPEVVATFDPGGVMFWNVNTPDEYERACARAAMA